MSVNKLKNIWISNDITNLQGTYNKVSILNEGTTELKSDTLIDTKLAINKNIDSVNDYKLDVSGNINFTGNLYKNNTLFTSGISLSDIQGNANTFTNTNTFSGDLVLSNKNIIQKVIRNSGVSTTTTPIYWNFGDPQILYLVGQSSNMYFILPNITSSSQFGTIFYIVISAESSVPTTITINTNSPYTWLDETNTWVSSRLYPSTSRVFAFVCFQNVSGWKLLFSQNINTSAPYAWSGGHSFNTTLPTTTITTGFTGPSFITKDYADSTYGTVYVKNDANENSFLLGSGNSTLTGYSNFSAGANALKYVTTGYLNVGIGRRALYICQGGTENFALGSGSLESLSSGSFNTAIGVSTGGNLTTGSSNTFIGRYSGGNLSTQNNNTFCGYFSGTLSTGEGNTLYGAYTLGNNCSGSANTMIGFSCGRITSLSGSNNTLIGSSSDLSSATISNSCAIGFGSIATNSNGIYLGRLTEITYPVGGLTINSGTVLTLLGNISANSLTITPTQLSFLNQVSSNKITSSTISDISSYLTTATASTTYQTKITDGSLPLTALAGQTSVMAFPVGTSFSNQPNTTTTTGVIWDFLNSSGTRRGWINGSSATAVAYNTSSDKRLKKDIENLPSQIDNIKKLNVRKYKWIESNEDDIGFIYQEVKEVFPLFDDKQDDTNYHGLDYGKFTPYLWSGVLELINRLEALENNVNVESNPNVYLLKDVIQQQKDFKTQLNLQEEKLNNQIAQSIIIQQQEKINCLENMVSMLQKQLNTITNVLISKNIL